MICLLLKSALVGILFLAFDLGLVLNSRFEVSIEYGYIEDGGEGDGTSTTPGSHSETMTVTPQVLPVMLPPVSQSQSPKSYYSTTWHCDCFASKIYCDDSSCVHCYNNVENDAARREAVQATLKRNPNAFRPQIASSPHRIIKDT